MTALRHRAEGHWLLSPFVLLALYAVAVGLYTLRRDTLVGERWVEERTLKQVTLEMTHLQAMLERDLGAGRLAAVREQIAGLGSNPNLEIGLLINEEQEVLASTRLALIGRPVQEAWPALTEPAHSARMQQARQGLTGIVEVSAEGRLVVGYYPISLSSGEDPGRVGFLFLQHDLTVPKTANRHDVEWSVIRSSLQLLLIAAAMALLVRFAVGRRMQELVLSARKLVRGEAREEPPGGDVLGNLGEAFDEMAEEIGRSRQKIEENEERFQTLVDRTPDAIFIHRQGRLIFVNPAGVSMLGYERAEELQGRLVAECVAPGDAAVLDEPSGGNPASELQFLHRTGRQVLGEVVTFPMLFDGQPAVVSIVRDVTERKAVEAKLRAADRMASLGTLAASVAHDINNPLSYMMSNLRYIDDELRAMEASGESVAGERGLEMLQALQDTLSGGTRVSEIVRDLKTFSRGDEQRSGPVNVHAVLDLCANMAHGELRHRARLVKEYGALPLIEANETRLGQVFLNLIVNAAQAIPEGADLKTNEVRISTSLDEEGWVVVAVKDTGMGIPPENLSRLYDAFFTTKPAGVGTGLGLSICHGIITGMGGRITVESEVGRGTTFRIFLPPPGKQAPRAERPSRSMPRPSGLHGPPEGGQ